jgi:hypothetical protein
MDVSGQVQSLVAQLPRKGPLIPIELEAGLASSDALLPLLVPCVTTAELLSSQQITV